MFQVWSLDLSSNYAHGAPESIIVSMYPFIVAYLDVFGSAKKRVRYFDRAGKGMAFQIPWELLTGMTIVECKYSRWNSWSWAGIHQRLPSIEGLRSAAFLVLVASDSAIHTGLRFISATVSFMSDDWISRLTIA